MMRLLNRAFRRAQLPVMFSEGFSPKMKLRLAWPLSVGMTSDKEYADVLLPQKIDVDLICKNLNKIMPSGCRIFDFRYINKKNPSLTEQVVSATWQIQTHEDVMSQMTEIQLENNIKNVLQQEDGSKVYLLTLPAGPKKNISVTKMFPEALSIHRVELQLIPVLNRKNNLVACVIHSST